MLWFIGDSNTKSNIASGVQFPTMVSNSCNVLNKIKYNLPSSFSLHWNYLPRKFIKLWKEYTVLLCTPELGPRFE